MAAPSKPHAPSRQLLRFFASDGCMLCYWLVRREQSGLGHNNHKQKIQYHLRLKQELEEMRHECTVLLRDKFQLEQCIRWVLRRRACSGLLETQFACNRVSTCGYVNQGFTTEGSGRATAGDLGQIH